MPRGNQLSRQWRLLQLIERPAGVTVDDAADELGCHRRTVWRDLRVLQDAGFPLYDEKADDGSRGLWRLSPAFRASPASLTAIKGPWADCRCDHPCHTSPRQSLSYG
jgi:predicted DNA-binding transcriptional regulator YafY